MSRRPAPVPLLLALLLALLLLVPAGTAAAKPEPSLDPRDVVVAAVPDGQVLVATGTFGLRSGSETRLVRTLRVSSGADGALSILPLAVSARGQAVAIEAAVDEAGMRSTSISGSRLLGSESPLLAAASAPLLYQWSGAALAADGSTLVVGPPTADGGVRPPAGGPDGTAWTETESPIYHALFAPPDLDLLPVFAALPGKWVKEQERRKTRAVRRPAGLPAWTQQTAVHYLGVTKERALFELEVVTTGDVWPGEAAWTLERRAVGSLLVLPDGRLFHGHVEVTGTVKDGDGREVHVVVAACDLQPLEGEAPAAGAAARFAAALALRAGDPAGFRAALLQDTAAVARAEIAAIRSAEGLEDVAVRVWDDAVDVGATLREARQLADSPLALDVLEAHGPTLAALGILDETAIEELRRLVPGGSGGLPWAAALALPSKKLVLVKPGHVDDVPMLAHEYAHVISHAQGYVDLARIGLAGTEALDLAFVDVDGAIAAWALEEAQAEVTEEAVKRQVGNPLVFGFALKTYAASIRAPTEELSLFEQLLHLLYRTSPKVVAAAHEKGDTVEQAIARAFEGYSYQTRQLLFPREETAPSVLFPRARALKDRGLTGATRVGAFGLQQALFRERGLSLKTATAQVKDLRDDVVLRLPEGRLWITQWADGEAAEAFAAAWRRPAAPADEVIEVQASTVVVRQGGDLGADGRALLETLLKPVR